MMLITVFLLCVRINIIIIIKDGRALLLNVLEGGDSENTAILPLIVEYKVIMNLSTTSKYASTFLESTAEYIQPLVKAELLVLQSVKSASETMTALLMYATGKKTTWVT